MRGSWAGLLVAVGFTVLANVLLLATLVFSEWLGLETRLIGGGVLVVVWLLAWWQSRAERQVSPLVADEDEATGEVETEKMPAERDLLFREAQGHYLSNDWVATEQALLEILKQDARDVESRLMLATLWRHQGRSAEALRQLDRVERFEAASRWQHEIAAERMAAAEANVGPTNNEPQEDQPRGTPREPATEVATEDKDRRRAA